MQILFFRYIGTKTVEELLHFAEKILKGKSTIALYPGSFNPWHEGHTKCAEYALTLHHNIIILPDTNPVKFVNHTGTIHTSTLAVPENLTKYVCSVFAHLQYPNPTWKWVSELRQQRPNWSIHLVLGLDSFLSLPKWIEPEKLLRSLSGILVVPRDISEEGPTLNEVCTWVKKTNPHICIDLASHHEFQGLSSRHIRQSKA
jgi:nicotinate-nucleotide adenylyltransferase